MTLSFSQSITFLPSNFGPDFTNNEKAEMLAAMQTAYGGSNTAKSMFDNWFDAGKIIEIKKVQDVFQYNFNTRQLELDPSYIINIGYINDTGRAVRQSLLGALIHELGHALNGTHDPNIRLGDVLTDYLGDNQRYVNRIWRELGLDKEISYIGQATDDIFRIGYQYTNGAAIDAAVYVKYKGDADWNSSPLGTSRDLLIGSPSNNILQSGDGDDFLCGGDGDDVLSGGAGRDTAVYFGSPLDYDIQKDPLTGFWSVRNVRGAMDAGSDTLQNIEFVQFDGDTINTKKTYELKKAGLTFQTDFALVIDTTGSMGGAINSIKARATALIDAVFANDKDGRIGIVGFKDTTNGEPSQVLLPFTDQDDFAARKSAAIAAINNMVDNSVSGYGSNERRPPSNGDPLSATTNHIITGVRPVSAATNSITFGGGGDGPETAFDGLRLALNGSMGQWRFGAGTLRIALFTDAPVKDRALANEVTTLAHNIGATVSRRSSVALSGGSVDTFRLAFNSEDPLDPDLTTAEVQIFTIFTGSSGTDTTALSAIASANGGVLLTDPTNDDLVKKLFEIIAPPPINGTPNPDTLVGTNANDTIFGLAGNDTISGGAGNDIIYGGAGVDLLFGGAGRDMFRFNQSNEGIDKINDFVVGEDLIGLSSAGFGGSSVVGNVGGLDSSRFTFGTSATTASQRFIYNDKSGALFFDADGFGGTAQVRLAQLVGNPALTSDSFSIF
jgi:Ca2+-binding RTX toxin-like protein